jgi:hypothetical protein
MMQSFSPLTQRVLALGIALLLILMAVNVAFALSAAVSDALAELDDARFRSARLSALSQRPETPMGPPIPTGMLFSEASQDAAQIALERSISAAAQGAQLQLEEAAAIPSALPKENLVRTSVRLSGPEQAVLGFITKVEQGRPAIRFEQWRIAAADGQSGTIRFEGVAVAAWGSGR